VNHFVEVLGRFEVAAERLLDDQPGVLRAAGGAEVLGGMAR